MTLNLAERFFHQAEKQPDHPLILGQNPDDIISYIEFRNDVSALARDLQSLGVKSGDNIGLQYPSGKHYIAFVYAVWTCGACLTPIPLELTSAEKQQVFEFVHIDYVISHSQLFSQLNFGIQGESKSLTDDAVFAHAKSFCEAPAELKDINAAFIRFTSGTTGNAKGVVLSHEGIYERIHSANEVLSIDSQDRILWLLSMDYHFAVSIVAYLTFGASIILPQNSFGITLLNAANNHDASFIYGSPTHYMMMVQDDSGAELPKSLRAAIVTTTALRSEAADAFYDRFDWVLNETYGIIELGLPAINISRSKAKQGSVGQITPGYELKLLPISGQNHGEITVRGKGMLDAYYSPWRTRDNILAEKDGWFHTGDLGRLDEDDFLYIVGRSKEMISIGGMKFFPDEVETVLEKHPAIAEACVFAVKEQQWAEPAQAQLVAVDGETLPDDKALRAHCRQSLASHKIPGRFHWTDALTYTASGKKTRDPNKLNIAPNN